MSELKEVYFHGFDYNRPRKVRACHVCGKKPAAGKTWSNMWWYIGEDLGHEARQNATVVVSLHPIDRLRSMGSRSPHICPACAREALLLAAQTIGEEEEE